MTSSNLSTSLSDQERPAIPPPLLPKPSLNHRHEVIVTDADLRSMYFVRGLNTWSNSYQSAREQDKCTRDNE